MTAVQAVWALLALSVFLIVLLVIAVGGNANLAAENRRLRRVRLLPAHPSTRRNVQ